jgi:regulator of protease activity HflC (stomatin/prohibitin superfamily)
MAAGQGKRISDATRAAVMAALLEGQAITKVAADYKIDKASVSRLRKAIPKEHLQQVATKKDIDIASKIVEHLDASFQALKNILAVTNDTTWLNKQNASDLATFSGVTADKVFRVLEAIENAQTNEENES